MRELRLRFLGATIKFVANHPTLPAAWVTASHPSWQFSMDDNAWYEFEYHAPREFRSMLRIGGVMTAPGYLITVVHVQFNPKRRSFAVEFRGLCAGEKLRDFRRLSEALAENRAVSLIRDYLGMPSQKAARVVTAAHRIEQLHQQISWMMPNIATMRAHQPLLVLSDNRAPEPFHTAWKLSFHIAA